MAFQTIRIESNYRTLLQLASRARAGEPILLTLNGEPYAAIVSPDVLTEARPHPRFLDLRGSGKGLWGKPPAAGVAALRNEWSP